MAYVFACILGLLAAGQASIIPSGLGAYNYGTGIQLAPGALNLYGPSVAPSAVSYSLPINKQVITPIAIAPAVSAYSTPAVSAYSAPVAHVAAPVAAIAAPVAAVAPVVAPAVTSVDVSSQYHSQDELGRYSFGYSGKDQTRNEERDAYGRVTGSYSYVDEYGRVNSQSYIADEGGFRVTGNNLPVHHLSKRSLYAGAYPASTGPLVHGYAAAVAHPGYHVAPEIRTVHQVAAPVAHVVKPVTYAAKPVAVAHPGYHVAPEIRTVHQVAAPVAHVVKPVPAVHVAAPVHHVVKPVAHVAAPVHHVVKPVTYATKTVTHAVKPITYAAKPVLHALKPVAYAAKPVAPVYG